jgi:transcriptional regulator with XRE-family HTH domain
MLASLSIDHYSRLEQGRQATISESVLKALTRALRLDEEEAAHLRDLAAPPGRSRRPEVTVQRADPGLVRVATALDHVPVLLLGQRGEVLARNALLQAGLGYRAGADLPDQLGDPRNALRNTSVEGGQHRPRATRVKLSAGGVLGSQGRVERQPGKTPAARAAALLHLTQFRPGAALVEVRDETGNGGTDQVAESSARC